MYEHFTDENSYKLLIKGYDKMSIGINNNSANAVNYGAGLGVKGKKDNDSHFADTIPGDDNNSSWQTVDNDPLNLKKAMKDFIDERLTGLTEDERAEIKKLIEEYLNKNEISTDQDRDAFNTYIKSLLKKFGFKGDLDEAASSFGGSIVNEGAADTTSNVYAHFQRLNSYTKNDNRFQIK